MISIKSEKEIEIMRQGGKILAQVLDILKKEAKLGVKLETLDNLAESSIRERGAVASFKGYYRPYFPRSYPSCACLSLNGEVVHGIPRGRILKNGDLLKIDLGVKYRGFHTDSAITVGIGKIGKEAQRVLIVTKEALDLAIAVIRPGVHLGDVGEKIESFVNKNSFSVVRGLVGHGIGRELQEEPEVPNFGKKGKGVILKAGMTIAVEPMVTAGEGDIAISDDGFTFKTTDGSLAAHFEHTLAVTKNGADILTRL